MTDYEIFRDVFPMLNVTEEQFLHITDIDNCAVFREENDSVFDNTYTLVLVNGEALELSGLDEWNLSVEKVDQIDDSQNPFIVYALSIAEE